jgi:hypothetical protein
MINKIMQLREIYYLDKETMEPVEDGRYDPDYDDSIVQTDDTRKTRLTLRDINRARRADDMHRREKQKDLSRIQAMYGIAAQQPQEGM